MHLDLSGLASLIWQAFIDHLGDVGAAIWAGLKDHLGEIAQTLWTPLSAWLVDGLRESAQATWNGIFGAVPLLLSQLPAELTYNLPAYRAIATDPLPVAVGGAMLAVALAVWHTEAVQQVCTFASLGEWRLSRASIRTIRAWR